TSFGITIIGSGAWQPLGQRPGLKRTRCFLRVLAYSAHCLPGFSAAVFPLAAPACCCDLRAATADLYSASVRSYQPIQEKPISSLVRPVPAPTQFLGSGLYLFPVLLSYQLTTCSRVPAGTIGCTSSW